MENKPQIKNNFDNQINDAKSSWKIEIVNTNYKPKEKKEEKK